MANIGINNNSAVRHNVGTQDAPVAKPKLERSHGGRLNVPEGLSARTSISGSAPRQSLKLSGRADKFSGTPTSHSGSKKVNADSETMDAIRMQQQQSANSAALAMSTAMAAGQQAISEHMKSMAEMEAKNIKSAGESLKGLA